jgi:hypothetical protein
MVMMVDLSSQEPLPITYNEEMSKPFASWLQELFHKKKEEKPAEDKETIVEAGASDNHQEDVDTILANALSKLSLQEREQAYEEIHGVDLTNEEKPELVADRLEAMEAELQKIHKKPVYDLGTTT